jgi:hypothetical protein
MAAEGKETKLDHRTLVQRRTPCVALPPFVLSPSTSLRINFAAPAAKSKSGLNAGLPALYYSAIGVLRDIEQRRGGSRTRAPIPALSAETVCRSLRIRTLNVVNDNL